VQPVTRTLVVWHGCLSHNLKKMYSFSMMFQQLMKLTS
jgi:hypothetical protein